MPIDLPGFPEKVKAALLGIVAGADDPADALAVAESIIAKDGYDADDLVARNLSNVTSPSWLLCRGLIFALYSSDNRPQLRRDAYHSATIAGGDENRAITTMTVALFTADLLRFDLEMSLLRLRQSVLEDAPLVLLDQLKLPTSEVTELIIGTDPAIEIHAAITALTRAKGIDEVVKVAQQLSGGPGPVAALAGGLAGARDGLVGHSAQSSAAQKAKAIAEQLANKVITHMKSSAANATPS